MGVRVTLLFISIWIFFFTYVRCFGVIAMKCYVSQVGAPSGKEVGCDRVIPSLTVSRHVHTYIYIHKNICVLLDRSIVIQGESTWDSPRTPALLSSYSIGGVMHDLSGAFQFERLVLLTDGCVGAQSTTAVMHCLSHFRFASFASVLMLFPGEADG